MLSTPWEAFAGHADRDRARVPEFEALAGAKAAWIGRELGPDVTRPRHEATQAALGRLGDVLADAALDALIVVGDDQGEWFSADGQPALCIYWGDAVENLPPPVEKMAPSLRRAYWGYYGDGTNRTFPVDAALGRHLVETLTRDAPGLSRALRSDEPPHRRARDLGGFRISNRRLHLDLARLRDRRQRHRRRPTHTPALPMRGWLPEPV